MQVNLNVKKRLVFFLFLFTSILVLLILRVGYIQIFKGEYLQKLANELHNRERFIKPERGKILDVNGNVLAMNASVNTISVIHNQVEEPEKVASFLAEKLELDYDEVLAKINKNLALERIKSKVEPEVANEIREANFKGVMVDEDFIRIYPYKNLASQVLGFVGKDNQGIIGVEVKYDRFLNGIKGKILTETDARGIEIKGIGEKRVEPVPGNNVVLTIDVNIQKYAEQLLEKVLEEKKAKKGSLIVMNPQNGEILAMTNKPDFDLNKPFKIDNLELSEHWDDLSETERKNVLNNRWRNFCINDTYEPGSVFKIVTASSALEEKVVSLDDHFFCPGYRIVADSRIRCHIAGGHGSETFIEGVQNSCNPVFMDLGERLTAPIFDKYMRDFGLSSKTGIDLPGEAVGILHNVKEIGPVELATTSFGQSFQITPLQLIRAGSAIVNGGELVVPHVAKEIVDKEGQSLNVIKYNDEKSPISKETSDTMRMILESVVAEGTGRRTYLPGYRVGGKTATSEKLPRSSNKYISSFMGFAPADNPQIIALVLIDEPQGIYYGGTIAAPVIRDLFKNVLPYIGIEPEYSERDLNMEGVGEVIVPELIELKVSEAKKTLKDYEFEVEILGEGDIIREQFPLPGELINKNSKIILYAE